MTDLIFDKLPFWRGVTSAPGTFAPIPFRLGWHDAGYVALAAGEEITNAVARVYRDDSYAHPTLPPGYSAWANSRGEFYYGFIKEALGEVEAPRRLVDIGAGTQYFATRVLKDFSVESYVIVDPGVREAPADPRIGIVREYFSREVLPHGDFDVALSLNCLEHVPDPVSFLKDAHALLKPRRGVMILVFPNVEEQFANGDMNSLWHEHVNYFTIDTVQRLIEDAGFEVLRCMRAFDDFHFVLRADGRSAREVRAKHASAESLERAVGAFNANVVRLRSELTSRLAAGQTVGIHGASVGLNNLLYVLEIEDHPRLRLYDGDVTKVGKYLPVAALPIRDSRSDCYRDCDVMYVAALSFFEQIARFAESHHGVGGARIQRLFKSPYGASI